MIKKIFEYDIVWKRNKKDFSDELYYFTNFNDTFRLRMNNFPEEQMYTFFAIGEEIDFDDLPKKWTIIYSDTE